MYQNSVSLSQKLLDLELANNVGSVKQVLDIDGSELSQMEISGAEKAAALFLVLGKEKAVRLANFFSKDEIKEVVDAAGNLRNLSPEAIDQIVLEFGENFIANGLLEGSDTLSEYFSEASKNNIGNNQLATSSNIDISSLDVEIVKNFFESEPPQISALLLQRLDDEMAVKIITDLEPNLRNDLFQAYLNRNNLEGDLQLEFESDLIQLLLDTKLDKGNVAEIEKTASLINQFSNETSDELVKHIEEVDPEVAAIIKKSLFKFSSVGLLSKEHMGILIDGLETEDIVNALSNSEEEQRNSVLEVLSPRNRRLVESELTRNATSPENIEKAQKKIVRNAIKLSREGTIELPESG